MKTIQRILLFTIALVFFAASPVHTYAAAHSHVWKEIGEQINLSVYDDYYHVISYYDVVECYCGELGLLLDTSRPNMILSSHSFSPFSEHSGLYHYQYNRCTECGKKVLQSSWRCSACPGAMSIDLPLDSLPDDNHQDCVHEHH